MKTLLICLLLVTTGCSNRSPQPVEIETADVCAQCKMAISEKRYAAEMADVEGNVIKFDNVDCMVRYVSGHDLKDKAAAWFVVESTGEKMARCAQGFLREIRFHSRSHGQRCLGCRGPFDG